MILLWISCLIRRRDDYVDKELNFGLEQQQLAVTITMTKSGLDSNF